MEHHHVKWDQIGISTINCHFHSYVTVITRGYVHGKYHGKYHGHYHDSSAGSHHRAEEECQGYEPPGLGQLWQLAAVEAPGVAKERQEHRKIHRKTHREMEVYPLVISQWIPSGYRL